MVDLNADLPTDEPELTETHPWMTYSRWRMAWHTALGVLLAGMVASLVGAFAFLGTGSALLMLLVAFILVPAVVCCALAAAFGPWLRSFHPFIQSLIFGGLSVVTMFVLLLVISLIEFAVSGPCQPNVYCWGPVDPVLLLVLFFGFPAFLVTALGLGLAIWSSTRRGTLIFWRVLACVLAVFVTVLVLTLMGAASGWAADLPGTV